LFFVFKKTGKITVMYITVLVGSLLSNWQNEFYKTFLD